MPAGWTDKTRSSLVCRSAAGIHSEHDSPRHLDRRRHLRPAVNACRSDTLRHCVDAVATPAVSVHYHHRRRHRHHTSSVSNRIPHTCCRIHILPALVMDGCVIIDENAARDGPRRRGPSAAPCGFRRHSKDVLL